MATLTKGHIAKVISEKTGFQRKKSVELVETLIELIKDRLASGEDVLISGFGKFRVRAKKQRKGRNPATGKDMALKARTIVKFNASGLLREKLNP